MHSLQHTATTATHCNILIPNAAYCNTLQHPSQDHTNGGHGRRSSVSFTYTHSATHCNTLQHTAAHYNKLRHTAHDTITKSEILQHTVIHCNTLQHTCTRPHNSSPCSLGQRFITSTHTATHCNTPQHTATHCNSLKPTATYCNTTVIQCNRVHYTLTRAHTKHLNKATQFKATLAGIAFLDVLSLSIIHKGQTFSKVSWIGTSNLYASCNMNEFSLNEFSI